MPQFHTTLLGTGKHTTGIEVPPQIVEALGKGKKPAGIVTVKDYTYRSTIATMRGRFMIAMSADNRQKAGLQGGDEIDVHLELDTEPRTLELPDDFAQALNSDATAKQFFESLSYSNKRRFMYGIEEAKTDETRQRRITKAVSNLRDGKL
jgi:hypothetical protein